MRLRRLLLLPCLLLLATPHSFAQDFDLRLRDDRTAFQNSRSWVYNDLSDGLRLARHLKPLFRGPVIANGGYNRQRALDAVARDDSDMVSFGVMFRDNPDLASRLQRQVLVRGPEPSAGYRYY